MEKPDLEEMLTPQRKVDLSVEKMMEEDDTDKSNSFMVVTPRKDYEETYLVLLKKLIAKEGQGVFVTVNKSASEIQAEMKKKKYSLDNIIFVDAVAEMIDEEREDTEDILYVDSPNNLVDLGIGVDEAIEKLKGSGFLIFDSLTTLLVYSPPKEVEKFIHSISQKIKHKGISSYFLVMQATNKEVLSTLAQFFDFVKDI